MDSGNPHQPPSNDNSQTPSTDNDGRKRRRVAAPLTPNTIQTQSHQPTETAPEPPSSETPPDTTQQQRQTTAIASPPKRRKITSDLTLLKRWSPIFHPALFHQIYTWREKTMALASPAAENHDSGFILCVRAIVPDYLPEDTVARTALAMILVRIPAKDERGAELTGRMADARFSLDDEGSGREVLGGGRGLRDVEVEELKNGEGRLAVVKFWRVGGKEKVEEVGLAMRTGGEVRRYWDW